MHIIPWSKIGKYSRKEIEKLQNNRLQYFIKHKAPYSKFYRDLFDRSKISFDGIKTTDDLQKLPFTNKQDIAPTIENPDRPRQFILSPDQKLLMKNEPKSKLVSIALGNIFQKKKTTENLELEYKPIHFHFTTGRTALPTSFSYTYYDLQRLIESGKRLFKTFGVRRNDVALNAFPYAPHLAFWQTYYAAYNLNVMTLHSGGGKVLGTKKIILAMESLKASLGIFMPGYAYHVIRQAVEQKRDFSALRKLVFGGERVPAGMLDKLKGILEKVGAKNVDILSTYAMTEGKVAWPQCSEGSDYHLYPDMEFIEIVDEAGNRVKEGEKGEIVYTGLDFRGSVVLRYRTGDITDGMYYHKCPHCGRTVPRINANIQRKSDIKEFHFQKVKGELVNLNLLFGLLSGNKKIEEWQIEVRKVNDDPFDLDELIVHIAPKDKTNTKDLISNISKDVKAELGITAKVNITTLEDIVKKLKFDTEVKELRIVDNRPQK